MDASRVEGEAVQARRVVLGVVAVGVAEGQPPLVAPPHVHPGPVDDVDRRVIGEGRDEGGAHRSAGECHVGLAPQRHRLLDARQQPAGDHRRRRGGVRVDEDDPLGHLSPPDARGRRS